MKPYYPLCHTRFNSENICSARGGIYGQRSCTTWVVPCSDYPRHFFLAHNPQEISLMELPPSQFFKIGTYHQDELRLHDPSTNFHLPLEVQNYLRYYLECFYTDLDYYGNELVRIYSSPEPESFAPTSLLPRILILSPPYTNT